MIASDTTSTNDVANEIANKPILIKSGSAGSLIRETLIQGIQDSIETKQALLRDATQLALVEKMANACIETLRSGHKVLFAGNGGSFSDSIHLAAEFVSRFRYSRPALAAIALGTNNSNLTAIGNDYGYESVFEREIEAFGNSGDLLFALSTSGKSPNILRAVEAAKKKGLKVFGWSGSSANKLSEECETFQAASTETARIQETHITIGHLICQIVESEIFPITQ